MDANAEYQYFIKYYHPTFSIKKSSITSDHQFLLISINTASYIYQINSTGQYQSQGTITIPDSTAII